MHERSPVDTGVMTPEQRPERLGRLEGKIALITGGSKGIGRAVVEEFAREGAPTIYVVSRNPLDDLISSVEKYGTKIIHIQGDISVKEDVHRVVDTVTKDGVQLDVVINNVGTTNDGRIEDDTWEYVVKTYETNLIGAHMLTALAVKNDLLTRGASVIFSSSIIGEYGNWMQEKYAGTKAGIHGLVKSLARSLSRFGIRVNSVSPGFIDTDLTHGLLYRKEGDIEVERKEVVTLLKDLTPLGKIGVPEDVVGAFIYLASEESAFVTGIDITVDGGLDGSAGAMFQLLRKGWIRPNLAQRKALAALEAVQPEQN